MSRFLARVWPVLPAMALFAAPALADVYFVTLTTGAVIETAHQPQQAGWDPNMVLLLTETGNWVGFPKGQIVGIRTEDPTQGFGIRINDKAIALGVSPNDLPDAKGKEDVNQRMYDIANKMLDMAEKRQNYTVQQFVEPSQSQGIPSSFGGLATGGGGAGNNLGGSLGGMMPPPEAGNNTPAPEAGSPPPPNPGSNQ